MPRIPTRECEDIIEYSEDGEIVIQPDVVRTKTGRRVHTHEDHDYEAQRKMWRRKHED